eukprot:UN27602
MPTTKRKASSADAPKAKRRLKNLPLPIFVVDEHNDAMLPFLDAVKNKKLPKSGVKMLHYDSHPDLGNIPKASKYLNDLGRGKVNKNGIHNLTDIATWITPLVLGGFLDEVIWICGSWCEQIQEGTYELVCGIDKKTGKLMTADADGNNKENDAVTDYWDCDGTAGKLSNLKFRKKWTLHVFQHRKDGKLPDEHFYEISEILGDSTWVLDIDEDFFSCNNPHRDDFSACFGARGFSIIKKIYDIGAPWDENLEKIVMEKKFLASEKDYLKNKNVKKVIKGLEADEDNNCEDRPAQ